MVTFQDPGTRAYASLAGAPEPADQPLLAPVTPELTWAWVHKLSQTPLHVHRTEGPTRHSSLSAADSADSTDLPLIATIRRTATIRRGTRMMKLLSARQFAGYLRGRLPSGFCYRAGDLAPLRTAAELAMLTGDVVQADSVVFALRWRAIDPSDYTVPFSMPVDGAPAFSGLVGISPHERLGPPVLGTGFAPSSHHLVPEFVTADFADLPLPANTALVAFAPDGQEITLYSFQPEQHAWTRMFGAQWRHLLQGVPEVAAEQEYLPIPPEPGALSRLIGEYRGELYDALADPPYDFRVLARARAARYPVENLVRRTHYATWRGVACTVVRAEGDWLRLRLCRPDGQTAQALGAQCVERGLYEVWAPATEVRDRREEAFAYSLTPAPQ